jgi:uncharacterized repeat protein (TIGR03803 family)
MKVSGLSRHSLCLSVGIAMLAGCGGSQPFIGVPGAVPQTSALVARATSSNYKVVHSFGALNDGTVPAASLIDVGGTLYGTTWGGGIYHSSGTVFSVTPRGVEKVLHSFGSGIDGTYPVASLIDVGGTLYGTTTSGGFRRRSCPNYYPCGTVFSVTPSGTEKVLHSFPGSYSDGADPRASLINVKGILYGTTAGGGLSSGGYCSHDGCGTVFSITPSGMEKVLYGFGETDGNSPVASLIDVKGTLYGTTSGTYLDYGTVFSIMPTGAEHLLYSFAGGNDGDSPEAGLINVDGKLYGTTYRGGVHGFGTVFSLTTSGTKHVLHSFGKRPDGENPSASLIDVKGTLYGTTRGGGTYGDDGTVFSISTTGKEKVLHSFGAGSDGANPVASLIELKGKLYSTTQGGGAFGLGTVFSLKP